jgi:hypothetical protein
MNNHSAVEMINEDDEFAFAEKCIRNPPKFNSKLPGIYGFVHHTFDNKYFQNIGDVWGPTTVDHIKLVLRTRHGLKDDEVDSAIIQITEDGQVFQAANVVGYKSGVYRDRNGNPYLILQSHKLVSPVKGDWWLIRAITESMFGPLQTAYLYAWLQWAYLSYETRSLAPGQLLVMVGPVNCGKTLYQEKIISALLSSRSVKCLKYLMDKTEFNMDLISNCHWVLSDSISDLNYNQRKTLTENIKEALCNSEQRLRGMHANPCTVDMCPRISVSINPPAIEALPIFEEGMSDKMMLFKVAKSSKLPDESMSRIDFEAQLRREMPAFAYFLRNEFQVPEEIKESNLTKNVRFNVLTYHHPDVLEKIGDVKRHVHLAEMLFKWQGLYDHRGSPLDMWSTLTKFDAESQKSILTIAPSAKIFGRIMTELAEATNDCFCNGVKVVKLPRGHNGRGYLVTFDPGMSGSKPESRVSFLNHIKEEAKFR